MDAHQRPHTAELIPFDLRHEYEMITLPGSWARERIIQTRPVLKGKQGVSSVRGNVSRKEFLSRLFFDGTKGGSAVRIR